MTSLNEENERRIGKNLKAVQFEDPPITQEAKILRHSRSVSFSTSDSSLESGRLTDNDLSDVEDKDEEHIIELQTAALSPDKGISCPSPVWSFQGASSVTQSPPIQIMSRPAGYDTDRIPASIFSSKLNTEWSLASNESVFSIHLGNSSFSRNHVFLSSKSGEVPKYEDLISIPNTSPADTDINEIKNSQVDTEAGLAEKLETAPIIDVQDFAGSNKSSDKASTDISEATKISAEKPRTDIKKSLKFDDIAAESPKLYGEASELRENSTEHANLAAKEIKEEKVLEKKAPREEDREATRLSYHSESSASTHSFHFPAFAVDNGRASSVTVESEKHSIKLQPQEISEQEELRELQPEKLPTENHGKSPKHVWSSWFSCFTCRPCCCLLRKPSSRFCCLTE